MLGPVRFDHIRDCARAAITQWLDTNKESNKKQKLQADAEEKERLEHVLRERDESIVVLRALLAEKRKPTPSQQSASSSPAKAPDYSRQPLHVLRRLEDVRDATIGWILKGIEEAEKEAGCVEEAAEGTGGDGKEVEAFEQSEVEVKADQEEAIVPPSD